MSYLITYQSQGTLLILSVYFAEYTSVLLLVIEYFYYDVLLLYINKGSGLFHHWYDTKAGCVMYCKIIVYAVESVKCYSESSEC